MLGAAQERLCRDLPEIGATLNPVSMIDMFMRQDNEVGIPKGELKAVESRPRKPVGCPWSVSLNHHTAVERRVDHDPPVGEPNLEGGEVAGYPLGVSARHHGAEGQSGLCHSDVA